MQPGTYAIFDTSEGSFTVRLFDKEAPNTVANFVGLAEGTKEWKDPQTGEKRTGRFYDGIIFHRIIDGKTTDHTAGALRRGLCPGRWLADRGQQRESPDDKSNDVAH